MPVRNRQDFKNHIFRKLGAPLVQINITNEQVDDRIDEALEYYRKWCVSGRHESYHAVFLHATEITYTPTYYKAQGETPEPVENRETDRQDGEGNLGKRRMIIVKNPDGSERSYTRLNEDGRRSKPGFLITHGMDTGPNLENVFKVGEELFFDNTDQPFGVITDINMGPMDLQYVDLPPEIVDVTDVWRFSDANSTQQIFDLQYQLRLHDLYDLTSASVTYFNSVMNHLSLLDWLFNGSIKINYEYREGKLRIYGDWENDFALGEYIVAKCYKMTINNQAEEPILGYDKNNNFLYKSKMKNLPSSLFPVDVYNEEGEVVGRLTEQNVKSYQILKEEVYRQLDNGEIVKSTIYVNKSKTAKYMQFDDVGNRLTADSPDVMPLDNMPVTDLADVKKFIDDGTNPRGWDDHDLIKLATLHVKMQWGSNLKKFDGVVMLGGVNLKGQDFYDEASYELEKFEKTLQERRRPLEMFIG